MAYRTTPKMAERKKAHRLRLLKAAMQLFGRNGFHPTTVPMIVEESGSSTGSFYFYFRNKEDVFESVLESIGERISNELNQTMAQQSNPFVQMLAAVERLVFFLAEHPEEARILIVESSGLGARLEEARRKIVASHARSVEQALTHLANRLPPMKPSIAARCWVGAVYEAVYYWLTQPVDKRIAAKSLAIEVAGYNLRGIGAPQELL